MCSQPGSKPRGDNVPHLTHGWLSGVSFLAVFPSTEFLEGVMAPCCPCVRVAALLAAWPRQMFAPAAPRCFPADLGGSLRCAESMQCHLPARVSIGANPQNYLQHIFKRQLNYVAFFFSIFLIENEK